LKPENSEVFYDISRAQTLYLSTVLLYSMDMSHFRVLSLVLEMSTRVGVAYQMNERYRRIIFLPSFFSKKNWMSGKIGYLNYISYGKFI